MDLVRNEESPIRTFQCGPRSNRNGAYGYLYRIRGTEERYSLSIQGSGVISAPQSRLHPSWGKYAGQIIHLEIGEGITEIESCAFQSLSALFSAQLPSTLTAIYSEAFSHCKSLTQIRLPNSLEYIGPAAFSGCVSLRDIPLNYGIKVIQAQAFAGCRSLEHIHLPSSITILGEEAFIFCSSLRTLELSSSLSRILPGTFRHCDSLGSITIPPGIKRIEDQAFAKCQKLQTVDLSHMQQLQKLNATAFSGCLALSSIYISESQLEPVRKQFPDCELCVVYQGKDLSNTH